MFHHLLNQTKVAFPAYTVCYDTGNVYTTVQVLIPFHNRRSTSGHPRTIDNQKDGAIEQKADLSSASLIRKDILAIVKSHHTFYNRDIRISRSMDEDIPDHLFS
jgi:hypothetical protein